MPTDQLPDPVIMVPGITATVLRDFYDLPPTGIWGIMTQNFERVALHPEDRRYEAALPAQVRAEEALEHTLLFPSGPQGALLKWKYTSGRTVARRLQRG